MSRVREIVKDRELFHAEEHQTVSDVARRMAELNAGAILVLENGELKGLFSERDLMLRVVLQRRDPDRTPVRDVMTTNLVTIGEDASVEEAMESMSSSNCRHLPVVRGSKVVAILSMRDVMRDELARKTEELHHMRAYINGSA
jgi:CBS domain-containing protein